MGGYDLTDPFPRGGWSVRALTRETFDELIERLDDPRSDDRRRAFDTFDTTTMPDSKDESWRYAELDLDFDDLGLPDGPGEPLGDSDFASAVEDPYAVAVVVDGFVMEDTETENGFSSVRSIDGVPDTVDKFAAARRAFGEATLTLDVPAGSVISAPYVIDIQSTIPSSISLPSISIRFGADSESSVILLYRSPDDVTLVSAPQVVVDVGDAARARLTSIQVQGNQTTTITHQRVRIGRDATFRGGEVGLGGCFSRVDYGVDLVGRGASVEVVGLYFGEHEQTLDYRMVMNHIGESTSSDVFLKGAVEDDSRSVFTGLLRIEKDARRTSAFETNRNLVLSPGATAHSVPNLEILCDDVVCGHGSSVGPLDDEHLYYLMSRGLSRQRSERLLVRGFFDEVIGRLPAPNLAAPIARAVNRRFVAAQEAGRVG